MSKNLFNFFLAVLSFAIYYLVISPLYTGVGSVWQPSTGGITTLSTLNDQYDNTLAQASSSSAIADELQNKYSNFSPELKDKMKIMLPSSIDPVRLVSEVNNIANSLNLTLSNISYNEKVSVPGIASLYTVTFSVKTSYGKFKELMHNYETSLRLFTIKSVTFTNPEKESDPTNFQVILETYYLK